MPYLVMGYTQGTGSNIWTTLYTVANDLSNMAAVPGNPAGNLTTTTDGNGTWIDHYYGTGTARTQKLDTWTFYRNTYYRITLRTANADYLANYLNYVIIGPFQIRGYRDGDDWVTLRHTDDAWDNSYVNAIVGNTRDAYAEWEILYSPIDASTAQLTVNKNGSPFGSRVVDHSDYALDGSTWQTLRLDINNDRHRVGDVTVEYHN